MAESYVVVAIVLPEGVGAEAVTMPEGSFVAAERVEGDDLIDARTITNLGDSMGYAVMRAYQDMKQARKGVAPRHTVGPHAPFSTQAPR